MFRYNSVQLSGMLRREYTLLLHYESMGKLNQWRTLNLNLFYVCDYFSGGTTHTGV